MIESVSATVTPDLDGERIDIAAVKLFPNLSRKRIKAIVDGGGAYINKRRILFAKHAVRKGEKIELFWQGEAAEARDETREKFVKTRARSKLTEADILFQSADFMAVNKPAGIASQATLTSSTDTILHAVHELNPTEYPLEKLFMVHRLDKDTSGVHLIARTEAWRNFLESAFRDRKIEKTYEALCFNIPPAEKGEINFPLARDNSRHNTWYALTRAGQKSRDAKSAETAYRLVQKFPRANASHIECYPKTGRTHQIRVHLMAIGCPILGDRTYAQNIVGHSLGQSALRHMLHAKRTKFMGPDRKQYVIEAPMPEDFAICLAEMTKSQ